MPIKSETNNNQDSDDAERNSYKSAKSSCRLLRLDGGRQPPLAEEIPDAHAEMERRGEHADEKKGQIPRFLQFLGPVPIRHPARRDPGLRVKIPANIRKRDDACVSLRRVQPIPYPRICRDV